MNHAYWSVGTSTDSVYVGISGASIGLNAATARLMAQALLDAADHLDPPEENNDE